MIKKIGIFGGTFDPIHTGHMSLATDALEQMELNEVIFVPCKLQPFKLNKEVTDSKKRIEMMKIAIDNPNFSISTFEMEQESVSYTYLTMDYFRKNYGANTELFFICGTDSFLKMESWKESERFLSENKFIVGSRPGYKELELETEIKNLEKKYNTKIFKVNNKRFDISSTEIRDNIETYKELVDVRVVEYIKENELY